MVTEHISTYKQGCPNSRSTTPSQRLIQTSLLVKAGPRPPRARCAATTALSDMAGSLASFSPSPPKNSRHRFDASFCALGRWAQLAKHGTPGHIWHSFQPTIKYGCRGPCCFAASVNDNPYDNDAVVAKSSSINYFPCELFALPQWRMTW